MILRLVEECEEYIDFVILDKETEKVVGTFEIMEFPGHYTIGCRANKDFNEYCYNKLDDRLETFFKEIGSAMEAGLFGLDLNKPVYLFFSVGITLLKYLCIFVTVPLFDSDINLSKSIL